MRHTGGYTIAWDSVQGAISYVVSIPSGSQTKHQSTTSTQYTIPDGRPEVTYTIYVHAKGDGVNYRDTSGAARLEFTVRATDTPVPTATATPTATNTNVPAPPKKKDKDDGNGNGNGNNDCKYRTDTDNQSKTESTTVDGCPAKVSYSRTCTRQVRTSGDCSNLRNDCTGWTQTNVVKDCPTDTPDPYVEECRTSDWVSYTEQRPVLPTGVCKYSCRKQCCSGNPNRCWNHSCELVSCT